MKTAISMILAAAAGFLGGLLADRVKAKKELPQDEPRRDRLLLADGSPVAARHALISLQERPAFAVNEHQQPYAMLHDTDGAGSESMVSRPSILEEPRAESSS